MRGLKSAAVQTGTRLLLLLLAGRLASNRRRVRLPAFIAAAHLLVLRLVFVLTLPVAMSLGFQVRFPLIVLVGEEEDADEDAGLLPPAAAGLQHRHGPGARK